MASLVPYKRDKHTSDNSLVGHPDVESRRWPQIERLYRAVFDNAGIGIALVNLQGRPVTANTSLQRMLGYSEAELQGKSFTEFTFPEDIAADWTLFQELLAGVRQNYQIEKRYVRKDGNIVWAV